MRKESNSKKVRKIVLLALAALNSLTYVGARAYWYSHGDVGARLEVVRDAEDSGIMNYFVAGNVNQPSTAFKFLEDKIGGITYVTYSELRGCSMRQITRQVIADARRQGCRIRVFGISIGDYVSRFAEAELTEVETVAINPEPHPKILKPYAQYGLKVVTPVMEALTVPLGWLSHVPLPLAKNHTFSLAFLADQWRDIAYCSDAPQITTNTIGVICSSDDEFLQNDVIAEYFDGAPIAVIDSRHGDTEGNAEAYAEAVEKLFP